MIAVIPYFNIDKILRYGIGITLFIVDKTEKWDILIYENGNVVKNVELGNMKVDYEFDVGTRVQQINYADVSKFKKIIDRIEKGDII